MAAIDTTTDPLVDVLSALDDQGAPLLGNCSLHLGDDVLEFVNGRAKAPLSKAPQVIRDTRLTVPAYSGPPAGPVPNTTAQLPDGFEERPGISPEEKARRVAEAKAYLATQGVDVEGVEAAARDEEVKALTDRVGELERMLQQAIDLAPKDTAPGDEGDGEKEPDAGAPEGDGGQEPAAAEAPKLPDGFEELTSDGQMRCVVAKGDGSQCVNPAVEGSRACGLPAHQKKAAK